MEAKHLKKANPERITMAFITLIEIFRIAVMTLALGYIFSGFVPAQTKTIMDYYKKSRFGIDWDTMKLAMLVTAPAVVLHEMGHKFVALALGYHAEFFTSYIGLAIGVALKLIGSPFIIFIPGYVSIGNAPVVPSGIIALAGPLINLLLWLVATIIVKTTKPKRQTLTALMLTKRINGILFLFNMIPFGFFDGGKVLQAVLTFF
jgi:Zn-dependent protease